MNQVKNNTKDWFKAAVIRAIKTMAQTLISMIAVGAAIEDIAWPHVLSVTVVAGILSILTSIAGLPEVGNVIGTLNIDETGEKDLYQFDVGENLDKIQDMDKVVLKVETKK